MLPHGLVSALEDAHGLTSNNFHIVASDGGSLEKEFPFRCVSYGIAFDCAGTVNFGSILDGIDHVAFCTELWGLLIVITAALRQRMSESPH